MRAYRKITNYSMERLCTLYEEETGKKTADTAMQVFTEWMEASGYVKQVAIPEGCNPTAYDH